MKAPTRNPPSRKSFVRVPLNNPIKDARPLACGAGAKEVPIQLAIITRNAIASIGPIIDEKKRDLRIFFVETPEREEAFSISRLREEDAIAEATSADANTAGMPSFVIRNTNASAKIEYPYRGTQSVLPRVTEDDRRAIASRITTKMEESTEAPAEENLRETIMIDRKDRNIGMYTRGDVNQDNIFLDTSLK